MVGELVLLFAGFKFFDGPSGRFFDSNLSKYVGDLEVPLPGSNALKISLKRWICLVLVAALMDNPKLTWFSIGAIMQAVQEDDWGAIFKIEKKHKERAWWLKWIHP